MQKNQHSPEFIEQALSKARARGSRTLESLATELNMSLGTLKGWLKRSRPVGPECLRGARRWLHPPGGSLLHRRLGFTGLHAGIDWNVDCMLGRCPDPTSKVSVVSRRFQ